MLGSGAPRGRRRSDLPREPPSRRRRSPREAASRPHRRRTAGGGEGSRVGVHVGADGTTAVAVTRRGALRHRRRLPLVARGTEVAISSRLQARPSGKRLAAERRRYRSPGYRAGDRLLRWGRARVRACGLCCVRRRERRFACGPAETGALRAVRTADGGPRPRACCQVSCRCSTSSPEAATRRTLGTALAVGAIGDGPADGERSTTHRRRTQGRVGAGAIPPVHIHGCRHDHGLPATSV